MKKLLFILLAMLLVFSLIACDDTEESTTTTTKAPEKAEEPCNVHYDGNDDGKCDSCGSATSNDSSMAGLVLTQAVKEQFENANSMKIEYVSNETVNGTFWNPYGDVTGIFENTTLGSETKCVITVAKTDNGINLKMDTTSIFKEDDESREESFTLLYLVDGYVYTYNLSEEAYLKEKLEEVDDETVAMIEQVAGKLMSGFDMTDEEFNEMVNQLGSALIDSFNIINNKGSVSIDVTDELNALIAYIKTIDLETTTLRNILDDICQLIAPDMTVAQILEIEQSFLAMTVSEFLAYVDESLQASNGITLQQIYLALVTNEQVKSVFVEIMAATGEMSQEEADQFYTTLAQINYTQLIPEEYLNVTLFELILGLAEYSDELTLEEAMEMVDSYLDAPIGMFIEGEGIYTFETIKSIEFREVSAKLDITMKGIFQIDKLSLTQTVDMSMKQVSNYDDTKYDEMDIKAISSITISGISKNKVTISAPTNIVEQSTEY